MLMREHLVGAEILGPDRVMRPLPRRCTGTGRTRGGAHRHEAQVLHPCEGQQSQLDGGSETAGAGDAPGTGRLLSPPFRQAVDEAAQTLWMSMGSPVSTLESGGIVQAEVAREVDERELVLEARALPCRFQRRQL